jgi:glutamate dehydrogenase
MLAVFDVVEVTEGIARDPEVVMQTYFRIGSRLQLDWLRDRIIDLPRANRWQALARAALRDDLYHLIRVVTQEVLETAGPSAGSEQAIEVWAERHAAAIDRCLKMLAEIRSARVFDTTTLPVALREVRNLVQNAPPGGAVAGAASVTLGA